MIRNRSPLQIEKVIDNFQFHFFPVILERHAGVVQIFASEKIGIFFGGMDDHMPFVIAYFPLQVFPFPEHQIGAGMSFLTPISP